MESKLLDLGYHTPTTRTLKDLKDASFLTFDPFSPTDSSSSIRKLQRKPDTTRKPNSSRGKRDSLSTVFAGFYSPKQYDRIVGEPSQILTGNVLKQSNLFTRRESTETNSSPKQNTSELTCRYSAGGLKKSNIKQHERVHLKENEEKQDNSELLRVISKNKRLQQDLMKMQTSNEHLQQQVYDLSAQLQDLQKKLQKKQLDIKEYHTREKSTHSELIKLRQQNISLQEQNRDQQNQLDLLDRKYLEIQIQVRQMKKNKDLKRRDSQELGQKIVVLEQIIREKDQQLYKLISQNQKIHCQIWIKEQRLHHLENNLSFKKDALLEQTNKKLRMVNKELMHRVNSLLSGRDSDVSFELSPEREHP